MTNFAQAAPRTGGASAAFAASQRSAGAPSPCDGWKPGCRYRRHGPTLRVMNPLRPNRKRAPCTQVPGRHQVPSCHIAGGDVAFGGVLGKAITRFQDMKIARTGRTERQDAEAGLDFIGVTTEASSRAHHYPGAAPRGTSRRRNWPPCAGKERSSRAQVR